MNIEDIVLTKRIFKMYGGFLIPLDVIEPYAQYLITSRKHKRRFIVFIV